MSNFNIHYLEDANFKVALRNRGVYQSLLPGDFLCPLLARSGRYRHSTDLSASRAVWKEGYHQG